MTSSDKMRLLLARDFVYFAVIAAYFFLPNPYGILLFVAAIWLVGRRIEKTLKSGDAKLEATQKRTYCAATCVYFLILLGLLLSWIVRHSSAPASWCMGSLGIVVLLTLLYASFDRIYGRNAKV